MINFIKKLPKIIIENYIHFILLFICSGFLIGILIGVIRVLGFEQASYGELAKIGAYNVVPLGKRLSEIISDYGFLGGIIGFFVGAIFTDYKFKKNNKEASNPKKIEMLFGCLIVFLPFLLFGILFWWITPTIEIRNPEPNENLYDFGDLNWDEPKDSHSIDPVTGLDKDFGDLKF